MISWTTSAHGRLAARRAGSATGCVRVAWRTAPRQRRLPHRRLFAAEALQLLLDVGELLGERVVCVCLCLEVFLQRGVLREGARRGRRGPAQSVQSGGAPRGFPCWTNVSATGGYVQKALLEVILGARHVSSKGECAVYGDRAATWGRRIHQK
mgnify:CR=1 FL=1